MTPWLLSQAVEQAARRLPDRPALCAEGHEVSYRRLWQASEELAAGLQALGLAPGGRVGIGLPKSPAAAVAILGTLRAGGVYVPLDPQAPAARAARLIADCGIEILIGAAGSLAALRQQAGLAVRHRLAPINGSELAWQGFPPRAAPLRDAARVGGDLAYILYTSGSTGQPKGVMHSHRHALNFIAWASEQAELRETDRVASVAPFHFDLSIFDLFATWSRGACLCLLDRTAARFPAAAAAWFDAEHITVGYAVPSFWTRLLPCCQPRSGGAALRTLRALIFAGEVFPPAMLRAWRARLPAASFHNWYGPTETNVCAGYRLPAPPAALPEPLPIGVACPNFELRAADEAGASAPEGKVAYLWARGEIFLGYWGDAERTAAVCRDGWYNSGDLARRGEDGLWYFEGRRDDLVKCRGFRISLLEVQRTLLAAPGVRAAAVVLAGAGTEQEGLRAFVVGPPEVPASVGALRAWCAGSLPAYMIPTIQVVAALPETPTGKTDRLRLNELARPGAAA